jgi:hypothetical protein
MDGGAGGGEAMSAAGRSLWEKFRQVVVVVSTGRTGTQALAHHLDACYDDVTALHEPRPSRHLRLLSNRALAGKLTREQGIRALLRSRERLFRGIDSPMYVESNWYVYGLLEALKDIAPRAKVLHVVRDPRTYIPSGINFGQFSGLRALATRFVPYWYLKPEQAPQRLEPRKPWSQHTEPERLAWHWKVVNGEIDRVAPLFGDNFMRIRYEDLFGSEATSLGRLLEWIGLPDRTAMRERMREKKVNASTARRCPPWREWELAERHAVLDLCGDRMRDYGYDATL